MASSQLTRGRSNAACQSRFIENKAWRRLTQIAEAPIVHRPGRHIVKSSATIDDKGCDHKAFYCNACCGNRRAAVAPIEHWWDHPCRRKSRASTQNAEGLQGRPRSPCGLLAVICGLPVLVATVGASRCREREPLSRSKRHRIFNHSLWRRTCRPSGDDCEIRNE